MKKKIYIKPTLHSVNLFTEESIMVTASLGKNEGGDFESAGADYDSYSDGSYWADTED